MARIELHTTQCLSSVVQQRITSAFGEVDGVNRDLYHVFLVVAMGINICMNSLYACIVDIRIHEDIYLTMQKSLFNRKKSVIIQFYVAEEMRNQHVWIFVSDRI